MQPNADPAASSSDQPDLPFVTPDSAALPPPRAEAPAEPTHRAPARRSHVLVGLVATAFAGIALSLLLRHPTNSPVDRNSAAPVAPQQATSDTTPAPIIESTPAPTWAGRSHATWARDGSKTIAFELKAVNDVPVWMTRVRPALVVRCLSHATDVYVALGSTATLESQPDIHTVRIQIDDAPEATELWSGSQSQQELFAADGTGFVRRLARAHRLRFGFTPYNARPVTADFLVDGFEPLAGLVANTCGWRLDGSAPSNARRVSLKRY